MWFSGMDALADALSAHGYAIVAAPHEVDSTPALCRQLEALSALSRDVETATLELHRLSSSASFDDLVLPDAVQRKLQLLASIQGRVAAILAGKEQVLSFIQRHHARPAGSALPVHAQQQGDVTELFAGLYRHLGSVERAISSMQWSQEALASRGGGDGAAERRQFEAVAASLSHWLARYQRALEISERLTKAIESELK